MGSTDAVRDRERDQQYRSHLLDELSSPASSVHARTTSLLDGATPSEDELDFVIVAASVMGEDRAPRELPGEWWPGALAFIGRGGLR